MKSDAILEELNDLVKRIKMRITFLESENEKLKTRILELKKFVKEK
tara:strand:+ start:1706 stop:1843 length:138 start_codon:yes stop_codon:yes gene_type:complete